MSLWEEVTLNQNGYKRMIIRRLTRIQTLSHQKRYDEIKRLLEKKYV